MMCVFKLVCVCVFQVLSFLKVFSCMSCLGEAAGCPKKKQTKELDIDICNAATTIK